MPTRRTWLRRAALGAAALGCSPLPAGSKLQVLVLLGPRRRRGPGFRSVAAAMADAVAWSDDQPAQPRPGVEREREAELLSAWRART